MYKKISIAVFLIAIAFLLYGNRYKLVQRGGEFTRINRLTSEVKVLRDGEWRSLDWNEEDIAPRAGSYGDLPTEQIGLLELTHHKHQNQYLQVEIYNGSAYKLSSLVFEVTFEPGADGNSRRRIFVSPSGQSASNMVGSYQINLGQKDMGSVESVKVVGGVGMKSTMPTIREELLTTSG